MNKKCYAKIKIGWLLILGNNFVAVNGQICFLISRLLTIRLAEITSIKALIHIVYQGLDQNRGFQLFLADFFRLDTLGFRDIRSI